MKVKMHVETDIELDIPYSSNIYDEIAKWEQERGLKDSVIYFEYDEPFVTKITYITSNKKAIQVKGFGWFSVDPNSYDFKIGDLIICDPSEYKWYIPEDLGYEYVKDVYGVPHIFNPNDVGEKIYSEGDTLPLIERE